MHCSTHLLFLVGPCSSGPACASSLPLYRDNSHAQGQMAAVAATLGSTIHAVIDVARLGRVMGCGYDVRWRTIDHRSVCPSVLRSSYTEA